MHEREMHWNVWREQTDLAPVQFLLYHRLAAAVAKRLKLQ